MGTGASKQREIPSFTKFIPREPVKERFDIPDEVVGYPPPCSPSHSNSDIYNPRHNKNIYDHVIKAQRHLEHSWDNLVQYLTAPYRQDVQKTRSIFSWLGVQDLRSRTFLPSLSLDNLDEITPREYLKLLKQRQSSYASMFALLCRRAGIRCVIIRGISKGYDYEVGQKEVEYLRDSWVAVFLDGWRLIHPLWAYKALMSYKKIPSNYVEAHGDSETKDIDNDKEPMFNDHYFLIEPVDMINVCLPDNQRWQLLSQPMTQKRWIQIPLALKCSQEKDLRIAKGFKSEIKAKRSICGVTIREPQNTDCKYQLTYDLFFKHDNFTGQFKDMIVLKKYVLMSRDDTKRKWSFEIRMPVAGRYRITVYGGTSTQKTLPCICDVAFRCKNPSKLVKPYPTNPSLGFGPVRKTATSGLVEPSHTNGMLFLKAKQTVHLTFIPTRTLKAKAKLYKESGKKVSSDKWFSCTINKVASGELLDVVVCLQEEGEYALKIYVKDKGTKGAEWENACNYYLGTTKLRPNGVLVEDTGYRTERDLDADKAMEEAKKGTDMYEIKSVIQKPDSSDTPNHYEADGSFGKATVKMEYLEHVKALKEAISLQNFEKLSKVIKRVEISDYTVKLQKLLTEARIERDKALQVAVDDIVDGSESMAALDVLKTVLLVRGDDSETLQTWDTVTQRYRDQGTGEILRGIDEFDMELVNNETPLDTAASIVDSYSVETVKAESYVLAAVLLKVKAITDRYKMRKATDSAPD